MVCKILVNYIFRGATGRNAADGSREQTMYRSETEQRQHSRSIHQRFAFFSTSVCSYQCFTTFSLFTSLVTTSCARSGSKSRTSLAKSSAPSSNRPHSLISLSSFSSSSGSSGFFSAGSGHAVSTLSITHESPHETTCEEEVAAVTSPNLSQTSTVAATMTSSRGAFIVLEQHSCKI